MQELNDSLPTYWRPEPPASVDAIEALKTTSGLELPEDYVTLLKFSNGGEGDLSASPGWFSLWPVEEAIQLNEEYEVQKWLPEFFCFGSNAGGELLVFDTRTRPTWKIYMVPCAGLVEEDAILVSDSFSTFIKLSFLSSADTRD